MTAATPTTTLTVHPKMSDRIWIIDVRLAELPPSPNRSKGVHWAVRSRANKLARQLAYASGWNFRAIQHGNGSGEITSLGPLRPMVGRVECRIAIIYPASRRGPMTDPDSALARLKPLIDGLVDAGCLRGDGPNDVTYEPVEQRKEGKQLIVRFTLLSIHSEQGEKINEGAKT